MSAECRKVSPELCYNLGQMPEYVGVKCPSEDCRTFIVFRDGLPQMRALQWIEVTCPKCSREFHAWPDDVVSVSSDDIPEESNPA